jgi:serine/threonine protein kinase
MKILTFGEFKKSYHVNFKAKEEDEEFIGRGGYGAVFKGYYIKGNQEVAIKRSDTDKKLLDEVVMAAKVPTHPNIARYLDGFRVDSEADDFDVAILQYYPKGNLGDLFFNEEKKVKLSERQVDVLLKGVLEGLQFLHEGFKDSNNEHIRIIHRDLKPQNILIAEYKGNYTPLITDFGVSKLVNEQDFLSTGKFELTSDVGTLVYKAPEQIKGEIAKSNLDLWAFGVMLFKILTKKLPFFTDASPSTDAFKMEIMSKITNSDLEEVFAQVEDQPQKYQQVIKRCLVRDIKQRVQTAQELIDILDEIPDKLAIANTLLKNNNCEKAKEKFEEILSLNPNYEPAKKGLKDCEDSIKEEAKIIEKLEIAYNFLNENKYKEAQENFEIVLKKRPNQENALKGLEECKIFFQEEKEVNEKLTIANTLLQAYDYEGAKTNFEAVLVLRPKQEVALRGVQECDEAIKKVKDISANLSLAKSLVQEQKYHKAKSQFEIVLGLDAHNTEAKEGIKNCDGEIKKKELLEELPTDVATAPIKKLVEDPPTDEAKPTPKTEHNFIIVPIIENFTITPQKVKPGDTVIISWTVKGDTDGIKIKSSNLSFVKKVDLQGQVAIVVQKETVFTIEVIYGGNSKTKSEKVEIITEKLPVNPTDKSPWDKLKIPVSVIGASVMLYFGYTQLNKPSPQIPDNGVVINTQELVEKAKREREDKIVKGDSLFSVGNEQLDNGTDKMMVSNTFREAINYKPSLKSDVYKLFMGQPQQ